jgi:hypothetical protein
MTDTVEPTVITIQEGEESLELIAENIERLADAAEKLLDSRLERRTILLLLRDQTGLGFVDINAVLNSLPKLRGYLR